MVQNAALNQNSVSARLATWAVETKHLQLFVQTVPGEEGSAKTRLLLRKRENRYALDMGLSFYGNSVFC